MNKMVLSFLLVVVGCSDSKESDLVSKENASEVNPVESFTQFAEQKVKAIKLSLKNQRFILSEGNPDAELININTIADAKIAALLGKYPVPEMVVYMRSLVHIQVSDKYTIDVKKTDSLISPYTGKITLQKRIVRDKLLEFVPNAPFKMPYQQSPAINYRKIYLGRLKANPDKWIAVSVEFGFQNGKWAASKSMVQQLQGDLKPAR